MNLSLLVGLMTLGVTFIGVSAQLLYTAYQLSQENKEDKNKKNKPTTRKG